MASVLAHRLFERDGEQNNVLSDDQLLQVTLSPRADLQVTAVQVPETAGGLTTILEKSLGAVTKGGSSNMVEVVEYARPVTARGFVFMDTPGHDPVSLTGMVAGGANIICFTTGRGSVYGCRPVPSIKLATNTKMYDRMSDDMDINCGVTLDSDISIEDLGEQIFQEIIAVASGKQSKSEAYLMGDNEFIPWQLGAVM